MTTRKKDNPKKRSTSEGSVTPTTRESYVVHSTLGMTWGPDDKSYIFFSLGPPDHVGQALAKWARPPSVSRDMRSRDWLGTCRNPNCHGYVSVWDVEQDGLRLPNCRRCGSAFAENESQRESVRASIEQHTEKDSGRLFFVSKKDRS